AEDGIRDKLVTGVQTCALPIYHLVEPQRFKSVAQHRRRCFARQTAIPKLRREPPSDLDAWCEVRLECRHGEANESRKRAAMFGRSEERRVGKEGRWRGAP